jgi:hypothetical protein
MSVVSGCVWDRLVQKTQLLILAFYALNKLYIIIIIIIIIIIKSNYTSPVTIHLSQYPNYEFQFKKKKTN